MEAVHCISTPSGPHRHLTEVSPMWGCESPGEQTTERKTTELTCPRPPCSSAGVSCPPQTFRWLLQPRLQSSMAPRRAQAGPGMEPCGRPHSGAGTLPNLQETSQDSTLLQNSLWLCNAKSSLRKAWGDHPQSTEGSVFSLHGRRLLHPPGHTPAALLRCSLLVIVIQLEFVSFKQEI